MTLLIIGSFDPAFNRNRRILDFLELESIQYETYHKSIWPKNRLNLSPRNIFLTAIRMIIRYPAIARQVWRCSPGDQVLVLYPGWLDAIILGPLARRRGVALTLDIFISLFDTAALDRSIVGSEGFLARIARLIDRRAIRSATKVIADTWSDAEFFATIAEVPLSRFEVVPLGGQDLDQVHVATYPEVPRTVLYHGTFIPLHGIQTILSAAEILREEDVLFRFAGDGQGYQNCLMEVDRLGLHKIKLLGKINYNDVLREIAQASICLGVFGTSSKAGRVVPNKVLECAWLGKPIITRDGPGVREHFSEAELHLIEAGNPLRLADAIMDLLADPLRRATLGSKAQVRFNKNFSASVVAGQLAKALKSSEEGTAGFGSN